MMKKYKPRASATSTNILVMLTVVYIVDAIAKLHNRKASGRSCTKNKLMGRIGKRIENIL